jgi:hypothetical protein
MLQEWNTGGGALRTVVVAATGPSLTREDLALCPWPILAISDAWELAPQATWLFSSDLRWWRANWCRNGHVERFAGQKWTRDADAATQFGLCHVDSAFAYGLSVWPGLVHEGCGSGYMGINKAMGFGAERVILLGFDCKGSHFFGSHDRCGLPDHSDYGSLVPQFEQMRPEQYGLEVINCTRDTALTCFKTAKLEDLL